MDWQPLQLLLKAPKKKYIKKLIEYAALLMPCKGAIPHNTITPIGQQFATDLELTSEQAHKLINTLIGVLILAQTIDYNPTALKEQLSKHVDETLTQYLCDLISKMSEDIKAQASAMVGQTSRLVNFDWQLDMQVATEKGKCNVAVVDLELSLGKEGGVERTRVQMRAAEFSVFYKNLSKIKEQLSQLVAEKTA